MAKPTLRKSMATMLNVEHDIAHPAVGVEHDIAHPGKYCTITESAMFVREREVHRQSRRVDKT
jgi:hypothetical protein